MHGRVFDLQCSSPSCGHREPNFASPVCEALRGTEFMVEKGVLDPEIPVSTLPRCSKCNALARPGVVWFGESIPGLEEIDALVDQADLCLVVGTSSTVSFQPVLAREDISHEVVLRCIPRHRMRRPLNQMVALSPCSTLIPARMINMQIFCFKEAARRLCLELLVSPNELASKMM